VNNCRGRGDTPYGKHVYYPLRITIDYWRVSGSSLICNG
jgi:hypothetical protein